MGSRFYKWGSIYSRLKGLLKHEGLDPIDKPLWFDIYERFPPVEEPVFGRPVKDVPIRNIFYPEDKIRAKIHKVFSRQLGVYDLAYKDMKTSSQMWIEFYNEEISKGCTEEDVLEKIKFSADHLPKPVKPVADFKHIFS